jgi:hypothetical protein
MSDFWVNGPRKPPPGKGAYIVQRLSWHVWGDESGPIFNKDEDDQGTPLRCFPDRKAAKACCRELETQARREVSPFQFHGGELELLTTLSKEEFRQAVRRLGLKPPDSKSSDWRPWWDAVAGGLTDAQREGIFDLLDQLHFYTIAQAELDPS